MKNTHDNVFFKAFKNHYIYFLFLIILIKSKSAWKVAIIKQTSICSYIRLHVRQDYFRSSYYFLAICIIIAPTSSQTGQNQKHFLNKLLSDVMLLVLITIQWLYQFEIWMNISPSQTIYHFTHKIEDVCLSSFVLKILSILHIFGLQT